MTYRRKWGVAGRTHRPATPAQKGQALGTSGLIADWPFTRKQPGGKCDATAAQDEPQERGNPPRALRPIEDGAGIASPQARGRVGWSKQPRPGGNGRDMPTWTTMAGRKRSKSECTRHEPDGSVAV